MPRSVPITLDRERQLKYDMNALCDADDVGGDKVTDLVFGRHMGVSALRVMLWAGLKHEDPKLTLKTTGDLMQAYIEREENGLVELLEKVREGLNASGLLGGAEKNGRPEAAAKPQASGTTSTTQGA